MPASEPSSETLPSPILRLYPELRRFAGRQEQWRALVRANVAAQAVFLALTLVGTAFLPDAIEWFGRTWLGLGGAVNDLFAAGSFIAIVLAATALIGYGGARLVRRRLRRELATRGELLCVPCGYDLTGLTEPRCPECGHPLTDAQRGGGDDSSGGTE